ncbi:MAG: hypothetical protein H6765_10195 [Candidatus Peribacteria bacterium]|nr:MAG: hypothetical protein H6765_10195 [Candidatus Peribacteria bacterium]
MDENDDGDFLNTAVEDAVYGGDANGDSIPDAYQPLVATLPGSEGGISNTIAIAGGATCGYISAGQVLTGLNLPDPTYVTINQQSVQISPNLPYGMVDFSVSDSECASLSVTVYMH